MTAVRTPTTPPTDDALARVAHELRGPLAVATINAWNRMCISFRAVPGSTPNLPKNPKSAA